MTAQERIDAALVAREKATPGPWHVMENGFGKTSGGFPTVYAIDDELRYIAKCADYVNIRTTDNNANATLIAAAPDLVDEVIRLRKWQQEAVRWLGEARTPLLEQIVLWSGRVRKELYRQYLTQLDRLIAEAEGE